MSKELEMLREWVELADAPETIDLFGNKVRQATLDADALRRTLARLEAAERVCERWIAWDKLIAAFASGKVGSDAVSDAALGAHDAIRAYRALDGKGEGE